MKTKLLDAFQTKFTGVDAQLLEGIADKLAKTITTEEEVTTAIKGGISTSFRILWRPLRKPILTMFPQHMGFSVTAYGFHAHRIWVL